MVAILLLLAEDLGNSSIKIEWADEADLIYFLENVESSKASLTYATQGLKLCSTSLSNHDLLAR